MSDKKRRDITLGEMQDECSFRGRNCETVGGEPCEYYRICNQIRTKSCLPPEDWDLADPPRFTDAQMAALSESYASGVTKISKTKYALHFVISSIMSEIVVGNIGLAEILEVGETLDLAELLGKDGTDAKA